MELGDIGYFSVSLKGPRVMKKKDVHAQSIELKNVNFRVGSQFKKEVGQQMRLERGESMTRHHGKGHSEEECLTIINQHLNKYPCLTRTDYSRLTECFYRTWTLNPLWNRQTGGLCKENRKLS